MNTSFLLDQQKFLDNKWKYSDLMNYYFDKADLIKTREPYISLKMNFPIPLNILISKKQNEDKAIFIELAPVDTNFKINLADLQLLWGNFKLVDQTERDNIRVLVFEPSNSTAIKKIELVTREIINEESDMLNVEAVRYLF